VLPQEIASRNCLYVVLVHQPARQCTFSCARLPKYEHAEHFAWADIVALMLLTTPQAAEEWFGLVGGMKVSNRAGKEPLPASSNDSQ
jgi:hypothetical protein